MSEPYYANDLVTLYLGDCRDLVTKWTSATYLITDPPYGMAFVSNQKKVSYREKQARAVAGDKDTAVRDAALTAWLDAHGFGTPPWAMFGRWDCPRPEGVAQMLVWHKAGNGPGMGDTDLAFGIDHEEIYLGGRWERRPDVKRHGSVLVTQTSQTSVTTKIGHPTPKPVPLMEQLVRVTPDDAVIADPFSGSGSTLVAAYRLRRRAIGVELEERYAEIIARRLDDESNDLFSCLTKE